MSYAYAIQPPAGLGLPLDSQRFGHRKVANEERINMLRKLAKVNLGAVRERTKPLPVPPQEQQAPGSPGSQDSPPSVDKKTETPTAPQEYGFANRLEDIWNFIKHGLTLLWYRKGARENTLTAEQWKSFQEAAKGLSNNRTVKDFFPWWYGSEKGPQEYGRIAGLGEFAQAAPHLHQLKQLSASAKPAFTALSKLKKDVGGGKPIKWSDARLTLQGRLRNPTPWGPKSVSIPGVKPVLTEDQVGSIDNIYNYLQENKLTQAGLRQQLDYAKKYGYMSEDDYNAVYPHVSNPQYSGFFYNPPAANTQQ